MRASGGPVRAVTLLPPDVPTPGPRERPRIAARLAPACAKTSILDVPRVTRGRVVKALSQQRASSKPPGCGVALVVAPLSVRVVKDGTTVPNACKGTAAIVPGLATSVPSRFLWLTSYHRVA